MIDLGAGIRRKTPVGYRITALTIICLSPVPATANPYDDCILEHMANAQNKDAVYAIEKACINKTSIAINIVLN